MLDFDIEFDNWNEQKKKIDKAISPIAFKERDVFFLKMWKNVRYEQNWKWIDFSRPVVVIKKFNSNIFWWVALTSKQKTWPYYYNFCINDKPQCAIISQLRLYDKNRLLRKIWMINEKDFLELKQKIKDLL